MAPWPGEDSFPFGNIISLPGPLPRSKDQVWPLKKGSEMNHIPAHQNTVLVVDDEPLILRCTKLLLQHEGFRVHTAENGEEALDLLGHESVDVIVSDVRMPKLDGIGLIESLRKQGNVTPIMFVTAYSDLTPEKAERLGAIALLSKPVKPDLMIRAVRGAVEAKLAQETAEAEESQISS